jgi:hypothetical protein
LAEQSFDHGKLVAATAQRLRLIQTDYAQEEPATRQQYLQEELKSAIDKVPIQEQRAFLERLGDYFPVWESGGGEKATTVVEAAPSSMDLPSMLREVAEQGKKIAENQRAEVVRRLADAWGVQAVARDGKVEGVAGAVQGALKLPANVNLDPARTSELVGMLIDFVVKLEPLARTTWRVLKPESESMATAAGTIARFVKGEAHVPLERELRELRQMLAGFMDALSKCGKVLYQKHLRRLDPEDVKDAVDTMGGASGLFGGKEKAYWGQYRKLAEEVLTESEVEKATANVVVELVERITRGQVKG